MPRIALATYDPGTAPSKDADLPVLVRALHARYAAQDAIARNDGARAKRYSDLANADVEALEKFLGR